MAQNKRISESAQTGIIKEQNIYPDMLRHTLHEMPGEDVLIALSELYKIFGDSTRIKILYSLYTNEMCVCDIAQALSMTVSAISHQLRILKGAKLVKFRKDGKSVYYSLSDDHVALILKQGLEHICE